MQLSAPLQQLTLAEVCVISPLLMDRLAVQVVIARKQEPGLLWTLAVIQLLHPEPLPGSKILLHLSSLPVVPIQLLLVILPLPISMQLSVPQQQLTDAEL